METESSSIMWIKESVHQTPLLGTGLTSGAEAAGEGRCRVPLISTLRWRPSEHRSSLLLVLHLLFPLGDTLMLLVLIQQPLTEARSQPRGWEVRMDGRGGVRNGRSVCRVLDGRGPFDTNSDALLGSAQDGVLELNLNPEEASLGQSWGQQHPRLLERRKVREAQCGWRRVRGGGHDAGGPGRPRRALQTGTRVQPKSRGRCGAGPSTCDQVS